MSARGGAALQVDNPARTWFNVAPGAGRCDV